MQKQIVTYRFPTDEEVAAIAEEIKSEMARQPLTVESIAAYAARVRQAVIETVIIEVSPEALK